MNATFILPHSLILVTKCKCWKSPIKVFINAYWVWKQTALPVAYMWKSDFWNKILMICPYVFYCKSVLCKIWQYLLLHCLMAFLKWKMKIQKCFQNFILIVSILKVMNPRYRIHIINGKMYRPCKIIFACKDAQSGNVDQSKNVLLR